MRIHINRTPSEFELIRGQTAVFRFTPRRSWNSIRGLVQQTGRPFSRPFGTYAIAQFSRCSNAGLFSAVPPGQSTSDITELQEAKAGTPCSAYFFLVAGLVGAAAGFSSFS